MSFSTDSLFIAAITTDDDIMETIGRRVYDTAIPLPDEDADNVPVPYVIVTFDGLNNDETTKDDPYESENDQVTIGVLVTAENRYALANLTRDIRKCIYDYMMTNLADTNDFPIEDYSFSADAVQFDQFKPCFWQTLRYVCNVTNTITEDEQD